MAFVQKGSKLDQRRDFIVLRMRVAHEEQRGQKLRLLAPPELPLASDSLELGHRRQRLHA